MRYPVSLGLATFVLLTLCALVPGTVTVTSLRAADVESLPGLATVTGTVKAPRPFKAAQVHFMNADKNVLFMVYTSGGRYRAVNLFPGTYEVTVRVPGLDMPAQKLTVAAGARETLDLTLREAAASGIRQGE